MNPRDLGAKCDACPLGHQGNAVPCSRSLKPLMAVVGEAPGENEERQGAPFVGDSGHMLDKALFRAGVGRHEIHVTNALLCRPLRPLSDSEWGKAIDACRPRLLRELGAIRHVLTAGAVPTRSLTGRKAILPWAGGPHYYAHRVILPTVHPAFCARAPGWIPVFWFFVARAVALAKGTLPPFVWPPRILRPSRGAVKALEGMAAAPFTAWDVETLGIDPFTSKLMAVGVGTTKIAVSVPFHAYDTMRYGMVRGLREYPYGALIHNMLQDLWTSKQPKVFQNGQHDVAALDRVFGPCGNYSDDILCQHAAFAPQLKHDLGIQMAIEFPAERWKSIFGETHDAKGADKFVKRPAYTLREYNAKDVLATALLHEAYPRHFEQVPGSRPAYELYMALTKEAAMPMREWGIQIDLEVKVELRVELVAKVGEALTRLQQQVLPLGLKDFNPRSPIQLGKLFFKILGLPPTRWSETTGSASLDEDALNDIVAGPSLVGKDLALGVKKFRQYDKLLTTYIDGLPTRDNMGITLAHPTWNPVGARTGRFSSQEPNAQNIPKGMRQIFRARDGMYLIEADFAQLELRILAQLANARTLLQWFAEGKDVHMLNAQAIFGPAANDKQRQFAKAFVYGMGYGGSAQTIWEALVIDFPHLKLDDIKRAMANYFTAHPEIPVYQDILFKYVAHNGYVQMPLSGRRIYFYGRPKRTEILNYPIQGTAADLINKPTLQVTRALKAGEHLVLQVHDALYLEGPDPKRLAKVLTDALQQTVLLSGVPMTYTADIKIGRNWGPYDKDKNPGGMQPCAPDTL